MQKSKLHVKSRNAPGILGFLFAFLIFGLWVLNFNCFAGQPRSVRVAIIQDAEFLSLKIIGPFEIIDTSKGAPLYKGKDLKTTVTCYKSGILFGATRTTGSKIFIKGELAETIIINGRRFKGNIELIKKENGRLLAINYIDLEDYCKGILYHEASHYWPMEALGAQAIVSRTYAVYQCEENKLKDYDMTSDVYSQVYGGLTSERYRTNKAVEDTAAKILTYQGKVIPAFFHSTCGGHTEDASLLWDINIAPLKGVVCGFCKDSPHFAWHYVLSADEVREKLVGAGVKIGKIRDMAISGKDVSGRVMDIIITTVKKEVKVSAKDFRNIIGPNNIRSTNFSLTVVNNDVVFEGFGWGHGVGLCQWGAYFMAREGRSTEEILKYYYPGAKLETLKF